MVVIPKLQAFLCTNDPESKYSKKHIKQFTR